MNSKLRAYLQLFRLPNVFTALADVLMGFFVVAFGQTWLCWGELSLLLAASALLYTAGMVLNDVFDIEVDRQERPGRPLPSGRIELRWAKLLGLTMLLVGTACGWFAGALAGTLTSGLVATGLAACVLAYDGYLKKTPLGPIAMGGCRTLNVLLGMSIARDGLAMPHLVIAAALGIYIVGVTWFARTEARESNRLHLAAGTLVMAAGVLLLASLPLWLSAADMTLAVDVPAWQLLVTILGLLILYRCATAILTPQPRQVQRAVKNSILSLVMLDAAVCYGFAGVSYALVIVALLIPAMTLGRWIYST